MGSLSASGAEAKQGPETNASGRGLVLLIDDEQSIARAYARTLGAAGFAVEIAFDGVQRSPRYPGGIALRFARVLRYREDKSAAEADTIDTVKALAPVAD